jgi:hypothetical protein
VARTNLRASATRQCWQVALCFRIHNLQTTRACTHEAQIWPAQHSRWSPWISRLHIQRFVIDSHLKLSADMVRQASCDQCDRSGGACKLPVEIYYDSARYQESSMLVRARDHVILLSDSQNVGHTSRHVIRLDRHPRCTTFICRKGDTTNPFLQRRRRNLVSSTKRRKRETSGEITDRARKAFEI